MKTIAAFIASLYMNAFAGLKMVPLVMGLTGGLITFSALFFTKLVTSLPLVSGRFFSS